MTGPLRVEAGEVTADEILDALGEGRRVVVRTQVLGDDHDVTLRHDGEQYYCDTPTTLHTHDSREEMLQCIHKHGYADEE
jgi:hemin uptake protein HemP